VSDLRERFLELALRPFAGKLHGVELARGELMERLNHSRRGAGDDSLETATTRLEMASGGWLLKGKAVLLILLAFSCVLGVVAYSSWRDLVRIDHFYGILPGDRDPREAAERELKARVAEEDWVFLFANSDTMAHELRKAWRDRCEASLPDDSGWLEEYVVSSGFGSKLLRERILEQARRVDAGNGLWDLREARSCLGRSKFRFFSSRPRPGFGPALPVLAPDDLYEEAIPLLETAATAPRFETQMSSRAARRQAMLGPAADLAELADRRMFSGDQRGTGLDISKWQEFWGGRAFELERAQDREGMRRCFEILERLQSRCLKESGDDRLYNMGGFVGGSGARDLKDILVRFDLNAEAARLDHWNKEVRKPLWVVPRGAEDPSLWCAASAGAYGVYYWSAGIVQESDFEPGRRAEHAMADRMLAVAAAIFFGVLAWLAALEGWRRAQPVTGLTDGVGVLLRPSDFAWICGLGIVLPAAWHVAISGVSPLGCRDYTITFEEMKPLVLRAGGSILFATCMLVQSVRWRLAQRGGILGFRTSLWPGWAVATTAALFVPAMGAVRYLSQGQDDFLELGSAAAGMPLLWLLWRSFALVLCPGRAALPGVIVCRMLVPSFIGAGVFLLAAVSLLKREESKWVQRDPLIYPNPGGSGVFAADARFVEAMRNQMLRAMDTAPKTE